MEFIGIDSHLHLDMYKEEERSGMIHELAQAGITHLIAVSMHLESCRMNQTLKQQFPSTVLPAYGFHPEQLIPSEEELVRLFTWIREHQHEMIAIGEVGLPYYKRTEAEQQGRAFAIEPYVELLERFIQLAVEVDKPIILHAVYEDAAIACDLLEKYSVRKAHFHWFKGSKEIVGRMIRNGYYVSFTPDIVYEQEIQQLAQIYPLELSMVETDGPWPFEGPFQGQMTHPRMIREAVKELAGIKKMDPEEAVKMIYEQTKRFYEICN